MATVITYGTYDLFHIGHLRLLERAKALASTVFVEEAKELVKAPSGKIRLVIVEDGHFNV